MKLLVLSLTLSLGIFAPADSTIIAKAPKSPLFQEIDAKALGVIFHGIEVQLSGTGANNFVVGKDGLYTIEHIYPQEVHDILIVSKEQTGC